jgi:peptidoglycan biosynthesis protein MviN/MurJ (putative lipid II flippase)
MIQPITLLGAGLCFAVLFLRYRSRPKDAPGRSTKQKLKTAKVLLAAGVAWMALYYTLQHTIGNLDGAATPEPSLMERIVSYLSK